MTEGPVHSLKHRVEYALFCFWGHVFTILPYRAALAVGWGVAWIGHYLLRYRVDMVHGRIRGVFPALERRKVRRIAWLSWRNFVFNMVDTFRLRRINDAWMRRYIVDYENTVRRVRESLSHGGGAVGVSLHMGCAEVQAVCLQQMGVDVFVITGKQKNLLVDDRLNAMRKGTGIECIPKSAGSALFKQVFRRLKQGGVLTMLVDIRQPEGGVDVDFLGGKASAVPGMGLFAKKCDVPAIPSIISREGWTRHHLRIFEPILPDPGLEVGEDVQRMTQQVFTFFEKAIQERPEQWFWYNKNWILAPLRQKKPPVLESATGEVS
jgi:KDO2-lipid IV(A) lauroyltransferase